jgi:phosphoglycerate kinase
MGRQQSATCHYERETPVTFKTLDALDARDKRVLVRVDFNVPMQDGEVTDATRIERAARTLSELADGGAKVIALSHFGRPKGRVESSMSLAPVAKALGRTLGREVAFAEDCVGPEAAKIVDALQPGGIALLENLRFHSGEEKNDPAFAKALADLGDVYVNDAFSCSHRAHASVTGIPEHLPAYAGRLMQAELEALQAALGGGERPAAALIGGAKISSKLQVLGQLLGKVDKLIIGGAMANTFLAARGVAIGKSLSEPDLLDDAREIMKKAEAAGVEIVLPLDGVVAEQFEPNAECRTSKIKEVGEAEMILDVGPASVINIKDKLEQVKVLLWNGPMGAFEVPPFDAGTTDVAKAAAVLTQQGKLKTVAGGGDTVSALAHAGVLEKFSYVSTAGGAFLEWLEGKTLPGVAALESS